MKVIHTQPVPGRRLFSPSKAAEYLGISYDTLLKLTDEGKLKAKNFNGRRGYTLEELDRLIDSLPEWQNQTASNPRGPKQGESNGLRG